jgi:isoquinoline 1-oxidoreductase beta subunit
MSDRAVVGRRAFLAAAGVAAAGLVVGYVERRRHRVGAPAEGGGPRAIDAAAFAAAVGQGLRPNLFVHVAPDDTVTIACARSEMGQGVRSSLPALVADEMGCDLARVKVVQADGDAAYGDQNTDGSNSVRGFYDDLRRLGAVARTMLVAAAAARWGVAISSCEARDGAVSHAASGRSLRFGELANEASRLPLPDPSSVALRAASELRHVGKELPLLDAPDIATGRAVYGADVRLPGMLIAVIARPPVAGGKALSFDAKHALAVPGVRAVLPVAPPPRPFAFHPLGGVAIVADTTWAAMRGREALEVTWDAGDHGGSIEACARCGT